MLFLSTLCKMLKSWPICQQSRDRCPHLFMADLSVPLTCELLRGQLPGSFVS